VGAAVEHEAHPQAPPAEGSGSHWPPVEQKPPQIGAAEASHSAATGSHSQAPPTSAGTHSSPSSQNPPHCGKSDCPHVTIGSEQ
jgi:hypothetical protein